MKTILITGGANGLGKGIALHYLAKGDKVITVSNSIRNGENFLNEAKQLKAEERAIFIQADLSLVKENKRVIEEIKKHFSELNALVFGASRHCKKRIETNEGFEFSFALAYLSRFILSYGLKECLEKTKNPVIMNVCGTGMKGSVNWDDLQHTKDFSPMKVMMHGSRLNDLLAIAFVNNDPVGKIKYVLYNPMAVQTPGMMSFANTAMKLYYKLLAKPVEKAVLPITALIDNPPTELVTAYKERKKVPLTAPMYNTEKATKLYDLSIQNYEHLKSLGDGK